MSKLLRKLGFRQCPKHGWVRPLGGVTKQCPICLQWVA